MLQIHSKGIILTLLLLFVPVSTFAIGPDESWSYYFQNTKTGEFRQSSISWDFWNGVLDEALFEPFDGKPLHSPYFKDWDYVGRYHSYNYYKIDCETDFSGRYVNIPKLTPKDELPGGTDGNPCNLPGRHFGFEISDFGFLDFVFLSWLVIKGFSTFFLFGSLFSGLALYRMFSSLFKRDLRNAIRSTWACLGLLEFLVIYELMTVQYFLGIALFGGLSLLLILPFSIAGAYLLLKDFRKLGFLDFGKPWIRHIFAWIIGFGSFLGLAFSRNPPALLTYFSIFIILVLAAVSCRIWFRTKS